MARPGNPIPTKQQVAAIKRKRAEWIAKGKRAINRGQAKQYAEALGEIRVLNQWLEAYA